MIRVRVSELENRLGEYLRLVERGESIEIVERGVVIARIEAVRGVASDGSEGDGRFARLVREGVVRPPTARNLSLLDFELIPCDVDAVQILIGQRGER